MENKLCQICDENEATKTVQGVDICPDCFFKLTRCGHVPNLKKLAGKGAPPEPVAPPVVLKHHPKKAK